MLNQCSKLRVHPAPGVHILVAGCTCFRTCAPGRCMVLGTFIMIIYRNELLNILPGARFLLSMHPMGAQNNSLISNTVNSRTIQTIESSPVGL